MNDGLKPLKIGSILVDFPVVLASLAGYSDLPYRLICRSFSAPYATTEAMLDTHLLIDGKLRRKLIRLDAADHPVAGQIMGSDPAVMASAASVLGEMGFDVIDLNLACPVKKVLARRRGGHLMREPGRALEIVRTVLDAVRDKPVTLKLRRAFHEADEASEAFWTIARDSFAAGVAAICIHARSVEQKYRGRADWDFIGRVKRAFPDRTIIGSGDIHTAADALRMIRETGVDGVTAARGAIGNPWLFQQARDLAAGRTIRQPTLREQREVIERHYDLACHFYGSARGLKVMRHLGIHYARIHPHPAEVRAAVLAVKSEDDWRVFLQANYT
jgi:nifR3 family TIM-barrel protein